MFHKPLLHISELMYSPCHSHSDVKGTCIRACSRPPLPWLCDFGGAAADVLPGAPIKFLAKIDVKVDYNATQAFLLASIKCSEGSQVLVRLHHVVESVVAPLSRYL